MSLKPLLTLALLILLATPAWSHDVWLAPADDGRTMTLVFGHPGDLIDYDPGKVTATTAIGRNGAQQDVSPHTHDGRLMVAPKTDTALIAVAYDHGIWTEDADENLLNQPKHAVPGYLSSVHEKMNSKALLAWSDAAGQPVGSALEIVPLANPFALKPGDKLPVQVLYQSRPLAGAEIELLGVRDLFFTNREGKVSLPIPDEAFQYILVYHRIKLVDDPDKDELKLSANLTFSY